MYILSKIFPYQNSNWSLIFCFESKNFKNFYSTDLVSDEIKKYAMDMLKQDSCKEYIKDENPKIDIEILTARVLDSLRKIAHKTKVENLFSTKDNDFTFKVYEMRPENEEIISFLRMKVPA